MPSHHVEMFEDRSAKQKKKLVEALTCASADILDSPPDSVNVIVTGIKRENWATGGKLWSEPRS